MSFEFLGFLPQVFLVIAVAAWILAFIGFLLSVLDQFRPRASSTDRTV